MSDFKRNPQENSEEQEDLWQEAPRRRFTLRALVNLLAALMLVAVVAIIVADA